MHFRAAVSAAAAASSPLSRVSGASSPPRVSYSRTHTVRCIPSVRARRREPRALLAAVILSSSGGCSNPRPEHMLCPPLRAAGLPDSLT